MNNNLKEKDIEELLLKYKFAKETLETELNILLTEYEFDNNYNPVEHVKSRLKSIDSAVLKLERKGYDLTVDNLKDHVHDMVGFRIVCSFLSDVKSVVKLIKKSKIFKIRDESDYIKKPKDSGYISYHMNVLVPVHFSRKTEYIEAEIQIRTVAMDFWASLDHKLRYKMMDCIPDDTKQEIYDCSEVIKNLDVKMEKLHQKIQKNNFYKEEVRCLIEKK